MMDNNNRVLTVVLLGMVIGSVTVSGQRAGNGANSESQVQVIADLGKMIVDNCPPMLCTGLDCAVVTERNGCQLCACPIGSPARGCDPMPFILWHDLIVSGCPNISLNSRSPAQKVHRWFRRVNRFSNTDQCEPYIFPYCPELDFNLWRSPRTKQECETYCYSSAEQKKRGIVPGPTDGTP